MSPSSPYTIITMDEDAIDTEALQAQIDLSMSFAQNLVSSWIQPHKIPRNLHKKDLEKELSEYMQRPARLGVGASIPEGYNFATREMARLKGKLAGTKHSRDDDDDALAPQKLSDSERESRAISIKKKAKYDPFDVVHGKKKKKEKDIGHEDANPQSITASSSVTQQQATISPKEIADHCLDGLGPHSPTLSPSKKRKKRKKLTVENGGGDIEGCEAGPSSAPLCNGSSNIFNPPSTPPRSSNLDATPQSQRTVDVSHISTPAHFIQPRHKMPFDLLKRPLLNLNGPTSDGEGTPSSSPKKKRRRRRKKKNVLIPGGADTKIDDAGNISSSPK